MVQSKAATVAEYLKEADAARRPALTKFRKLARAGLPGCDEAIDYGMVVYKSGGEMVTAFANQKGYIAFYAGRDAIEAHRQDLAGIDCGKGCVRYRKIDQIDFDIVASLFQAIAASKLSV